VSRHEHLLLDGPDGKIEVFVEGHENPQGIALIAHPHPLFGGTADNKVVTTLARAFRERGCITLRPHFRGVGGSEGEHDHGEAETDDLLALHDWARAGMPGVLTASGAPLPLYLAGFSFGAYVTTRLAKRLAAAGDPARWLVLVGTAAGFVEGMRSYETEAVPADTLVIHGARTIPCASPTCWPGPSHGPAGGRDARAPTTSSTAACTCCATSSSAPGPARIRDPKAAQPTPRSCASGEPKSPPPRRESGRGSSREPTGRRCAAQVLRRPRSRRRPRLRIAARRMLRPARSQRRRQDHHAALLPGPRPRPIRASSRWSAKRCRRGRARRA
jgi:alpha/beta superfamily hydrolase